MSIRVYCPGCEATLSLADNLAGKKIRCKKCETILSVPRQDPDEDEAPRSSKRGSGSPVRSGPPPLKPSSGEPSSRGRRFRDDDDDDDAEDEEESPRRGKKKSGPNVPVLLGIGGGIVAVVAVIVVLILSGGSSNPPPDDKVAKVVPINDPGPAKDEPGKGDPGKVDPGKKEVEPPMGGPLPVAIDKAQVQKVKKSTVFIRVTMPGGAVGEGSGFFAFQPGIVLTNAHVLGMLNADARRPIDVKVITNSGEPDERTLPGQILGVDRHSDLAVLRIPGDPATLPPPLPVSSAKELSELQKVYIFGFPFGTKLGRNMTVVESSISSIRKDEEGLIEKLQVNGGMHPGNSGGPVVDSRGHVVGVSVSGIRGTNINFAVPGDFVHVILDGRISEFGIEPPYLDGGKLVSNVQLVCIDPLNRMKEAKVDVWVGPMGAGRKPSTERPIAMADDSPRQSFPVTLKNGTGGVDIDLPALPAGRAYYFQAVLTNGSGVTKWAGCSPYVPPPLEPFERKSVDLRQKYNVVQRTLNVKSTSKIKIPDTEKTHSLTFAMDVDMKEQIRHMGATITANMGYLRARMGVDMDGRSLPKSSRMQKAIEGLTFVTEDHQIDAFGNIKRSKANYNTVPAILKDDAADLHDQVAESLEALTVPTPNRVVNPRETWTSVRPLLLFNDGKAQMAKMEITYTYDGCRKRDGKEEARISFSGVVKGRAGRESEYGGKVEGIALFDTAAGYISQAQADVTFDMDLQLLDATLPAVGTLHAEIRRVPGFVVAKETPGPGPGPGGAIPAVVTPLAKGNVVFQNINALTIGDFPDNVGKGKAKVFTLKMKKNRTYQIDVVTKAFDPMVRVETSAAKVLAGDDDGGGDLNSRLIFQCPADGVYRIVVTSFAPNSFGPFQVMVKEGS